LEISDSEYRYWEGGEKFFGIFCKSYLPIGKKRIIFAVLLRETRHRKV
jgi:hypothetical protein